MDLEYSYELKIPKDRIAVLIGKHGSVKKEIEQATQTLLRIDSAEGDVRIQGKDPLSLLTVKEIIQAIGRGFNPEIAKFLLQQDYAMEILSLPDYVGKSKKKSVRTKARVIGEEGKARRVIEELTDTRICVYGKTISIIGLVDRVSFAKQAIEKLFAGSPHSTVYQWLERKRKQFYHSPEDIELKHDASSE
ncbi:RNA-processing protein [Candidatus Woesearchaeota archaeon]|nr:RNA-processing protein [Candidatus Woesearchaeota archaeon]